MKTDSSAYLIKFNNVYKQYHNNVLKYLISLVGKSYADDIVQETFIKIHKSLPQLKDESKLSSWIYKIALNSARDKMRKESKSKTKKAKEYEYDSTALTGDRSGLNQIHFKDSDSIEEKIYRNEMIKCYISFVKKLPVNYYRIYVLSSFEGCSNKEIAEKLSISVETVKIRLHRAKTKLYTELRTHCSCYENEQGELLAELKL
jgi:RNA polymerase sigma-70 factor, ECF subfamily